MSKYITDYNELLKLHGAKVKCKIGDHIINDARVSVDGSRIYLCQNEVEGSRTVNMFEYKYSWFVADYSTSTILPGIELIATAKEYADEVIEEVDKRLDDLTPGVILKANHTWDEFNKTLGEIRKKAHAIKSVATLEKYIRKLQELA